MRMGSFLLGGILGAAAVMYMNRNNKTMLNMVNTAKSMMMDRNSNMKHENESSTNSSHSSDMENVENMLKQDPQAQEQVNEILKENNQMNAFPTQ